MTRFLAALLVITSVAAAQTQSFEDRKKYIVDVWAHPANPATAGYGAIAAKLWLKEDPEWCSRRLQEMLAAGPQGDMFWMYQVIAVAYLDRGQLSEGARKALRSAWKTYMRRIAATPRITG